MTAMRILYIFPHPDDETFGPAGAIHAQQQAGHDVHLLTLTRGEATKTRFKLGLDKDAMGQVRTQEMHSMAEVLGFSEMVILDLPDGELAKIDPRKIENVIRAEIQRVQPDIVVNYPVHGVSGFHDHLVTHAVVKRVFLELQEAGASYLKRLAFFTLSEASNPALSSSKFSLKTTPPNDVDCVVPLNDENYKAFLDALACYETYQEVVEASGVKKVVGRQISFEFFQESYSQPVACLTHGLN